MRAKSWRFGVTMFLCAAVAAYALWGYGSGGQRVPVHPDIGASFEAHRGLITAHAVGAALALLFGPLQFLDGLRRRSPRLHRLAGYVYLLLGVGIGGTAGLLLARYSYGGLVSHLGFGLLAMLWLFTGAMALVAAKRRRFDEHRAWMLRNFALALAAVTLRFYVPGSVIAGLRFEDAYPAIAWLCWVPNLIVVEWCLQPRLAAPVSESRG